MHVLVGLRFDCYICYPDFAKLNDLNNYVGSGVHAGSHFQCNSCCKEFARMIQLMMHMSMTPLMILIPTYTYLK